MTKEYPHFDKAKNCFKTQSYHDHYIKQDTCSLRSMAVGLNLTISLSNQVPVRKGGREEERKEGKEKRSTLYFSQNAGPCLLRFPVARSLRPPAKPHFLSFTH